MRSEGDLSRSVDVRTVRNTELGTYWPSPGTVRKLRGLLGDLPYVG